MLRRAFCRGVGYPEGVRSASRQVSLRSSASWRHPELLARAWSLPVARRYAPLLSQGFTSICGPTSVANVLRSIGVRAGKNPLRGFGVRPMSLDQVVRESAEVLPAPWGVRAVRPDSVEALRGELRASNDEACRFVVNFARGPLFGGGSGHHSPLGGYLEPEDLAFVLDVNRGFGPWLAPTERLFEAMNTVADFATGKTRGLARFERPVSTCHLE
ncbi:MAG: phytochelatin synthase [Myxococcus sp.]|nr:phytochelatin synthase [Myxococcus sp.]